MSRKRTQADKSWQEKDDEELPSKRSRRTNQAQNKENELHPNIPTQRDMEAITQSNSRSIVLTNMQSDIGSELKCGKIKKIVLRNFMCHQNFEVNLNQCVNVFVGLNGSGKSAILTALAIGLGSKAQATARSTNLKDLVRRGETSATIEITLSNEGSDAYDEEVYGKEIVVVRTINGASGASQYKIKNENGRRVISTSRQDLNRLTMCMNIQVENPVLILNQDAARSFLKECDPKKLFAFFMKATQVESIIDKLNSTLKIGMTLKNNLVIMNKHNQQNDVEIHEISAKLSRLQSVAVLRQRIIDCKNEIDWLHIISHEQMLLKAQATLEQTRAEIKKIEDIMKDQGKDEKKSKDMMCQLGAKFDELQTKIEQKVVQYDKARVEYEAEVNKEKSSENKLKDGQRKLALLRKNIEDLEKDIAEYEANPDNLGKMRRENEAKIAQLEIKRNEAQAILDNAKRDLQMFAENLNETKERLNEVNGRKDREKTQLNKLNTQIEQFKSAGNNRMMAYGPSMSALLKDIAQLHRQKKFSAEPRGPIGRYVEVTDKKYRTMVENILDRTLTAFIVNNDQDRLLLKHAMQKYADLRNSSIICFKFQDKVHDVRNGIVRIGSNDGIVLYNVLKVSDHIVMNCLIDQKSVERIVLVDNTEKAINLTQDEHNVPDNLLKVVLENPFSEYYPAPSYRTYSLRQKPARYIQANVKELIGNIDQQKQQVQGRIANFDKETTQIRNKMQEQENLVNDKKRVMKDVQKRISTLGGELEELNAIEYPEQEDVELKREFLSEEQRKFDMWEQKFREMTDKHKTLLEISNNFKKKVDEAQQDHEQTRAMMFNIRETIQKTEIDLKEMKNDMSNKKNQLQNCKIVENGHAAEVGKLQNEVQQMMQNATGKRVECKRPEEDIRLQMKSLENKIERIESNNENIEEISQLLADKTRAQESQKLIMDGLKQVEKMLAKMRDCRFLYVKKLRDHMIMRVRHKFAQLMELRAYSAQMEVDKKEKTLELKVIPRDSSIEGAVSNTKSLSGGERSYSTVSFLIALWSCVDHPFYFLDEYDVFSDEYNRHIMTNLLFNEAQKNPSKQYGFLTPQDFSNIQANNQITIHKLEDPARKE